MNHTLPASPAAVGILEAELKETLKAITECFARAKSCDQQNDEFGHRRTNVMSDAVSLLKVSAELGLAVAKIKGEYNHNINVLHGEIWPPPRNRVSKPETFEEGRPTREDTAAAVARTKADIGF